MKNFSKCDESLTLDDISSLEKKIGIHLPDEFKAHYIECNGGAPELEWIATDKNWDPICIQSFIPIAREKHDPEDLDLNSIQGIYFHAVKKGWLSPSLVPFALDWGGNFFCIDTRDGSVIYFMNDVFDLTLSKDENQEKATRLVSRSFSDFLNSLSSENDAYG